MPIFYSGIQSKLICETPSRPDPVILMLQGFGITDPYTQVLDPETNQLQSAWPHWDEEDKAGERLPRLGDRYMGGAMLHDRYLASCGNLLGSLEGQCW